MLKEEMSSKLGQDYHNMIFHCTLQVGQKRDPDLEQGDTLMYHSHIAIELVIGAIHRNGTETRRKF